MFALATAGELLIASQTVHRDFPAVDQEMLAHPLRPPYLIIMTVQNTSDEHCTLVARRFSIAKLLSTFLTFKLDFFKFFLDKSVYFSSFSVRGRSARWTRGLAGAGPLVDARSAVKGLALGTLLRLVGHVLTNVADKVGV